MSLVTAYIEPAPHEFAANYLFDENGLAPFFAADSKVKSGGGSQRGEFTHRGERWTVTLYYQDSNIVHPGTRLPTGTEWKLEEMREFRLSVSRYGKEDPVGEQSFNVHVTPRWQGMQIEQSDGTVSEYSVPDGIHEAINVKIQGSNIEFSRYLDLLQSAVATVGIRANYFEQPHEYSNIQDAERYLSVFAPRQIRSIRPASVSATCSGATRTTSSERKPHRTPRPIAIRFSVSSNLSRSRCASRKESHAFIPSWSG